ncbi:MAG: PD-(D/E)XK nuclease family protein, partial [Sphaerospermopsis kisseleviana]
YLLAAQYLYPGKKAVASFYNLEVGHTSELITINNHELASLEIELANVANKHQIDLQNYADKSSNFNQIFPPNPGNHCRFCPFNSLCDFSTFNPSK